MVKRKVCGCVSKAIISPLTAKVKCPPYGGQAHFELEALEAVACVEDGVRGADDCGRGD
jgi:hypothetical protein